MSRNIYILHGVLSPSEAVGRFIFHTSLLPLWTLSVNLKSNTMEFVIRALGTQVIDRERNAKSFQVSEYCFLSSASLSDIL